MFGRYWLINSVWRVRKSDPSIEDIMEYVFNKLFEL